MISFIQLPYRRDGLVRTGDGARSLVIGVAVAVALCVQLGLLAWALLNH